MNRIQLIQGDCIEVLQTLPPNSVHCVVTSPPYWGLRDYGVDGQIGLEQSFDEFLATMVALFDEVRRVLHPSGTIWVNMGDSYNSDLTRGTFGNQSTKGYSDHGSKRLSIKKLHKKNLIGQPWRLAFALQAAKWILRSDIIWHKPNPMPESVTDRPTRGHEYLFLLSKSDRYFYDFFAVKEPSLNAGAVVALGGQKWKDVSIDKGDPNYRRGTEQWKRTIETGELRNPRTVWTIATEPLKDAHFAAFPQALVEPCVKAGTSEKGCCPQCFAPWLRTFETHKVSERVLNARGGFRGEHEGPDRAYLHGNKDNSAPKPRKRADAPGAEVSPTSVFRTGMINVKVPVGWKPGCKCDAGDPIPCVVLDPFNGSGTTGIVASKLMRDYIGIELNPEYLEISERRLNAERPLLFSTLEVKHKHAESIDTADGANDEPASGRIGQNIHPNFA